ncbi:outer membrane protein assembly factor BamB [Chitinimonas sp. BJB300]|uniref:outer membrane protein assembly factor BamB n=1 Tax=Chitinimonas sp. BJB300 TaxID=1559339 RepID=UPI000C11BA61|nr:outer membrane protein assembly factor BamB [Chitinimonas sp. BJB300]PHV12995.1 outer membrane protein assembly factor BamB [Chitinimonas sp. BJB300]TSJ88948.1 outer membrane protein assembly factor BamB [Chitinimonas sp. BJB300]
MKQLLVLGLTGLLVACAGTDNSPVPTELKAIQQTATLTPLWDNSFPSANLFRRAYEKLWAGEPPKSVLFRFAPDVTGSAIYMADVRGVAGFGSTDGRLSVKVESEKPLAGGIGAADGVVAAGTLKGELFAWDTDGKLKWQVRVPSEVISPPVIAEGVVVVRTIDGRITGLNVNDGKQRWQFQRTQPALILRNYAAMTVADGVVYAGLSAGHLVALSLADGRVLWESLVAQPKGATELERISDVTSAPVVDNGQVCAVAFQGRVACFAVNNGSLLWARDISSYAGLAIDTNHVYVTDDVGTIQAFERSGGRSLWKSNELYGRRVSGPVPIGDYIAVGDFEGYVHLVAAADGRLVARQRTDKSPIVVAPRVIGGRLLVQTQAGGLFAFGLK